jgi:hypothetical protein
MTLVLNNAFVPTGALLPEGDSSIPLTSVNVTGELIDFVGKIKISQAYTNKYGRNIEAKYMFNLDGNSVITGMSMIIGGKVLMSKILEKTEARETYAKAIAGKKTTCLLEKGSNGVYTVNVGNILADQEVKIEFEYLTKLECTDEGQMKFVLPTNISPKYDDGKKTVKDLIATAVTTSAMTYSSVKAPFQFHLNLTWRSNNGIMEVKSLTNEIEVKSLERDSTTTESKTVPITSKTAPTEGNLEAFINTGVKCVEITCRTAPSNGDFNVFVSTTPTPTVYSCTKGIDSFLMVNVRIPEEYEQTSPNSEYIIIVDRSGSMGDPFNQWSGNTEAKPKTKMDFAIEATKLFVQSLSAGCTFNVVSFGSTYTSVFDNSVDFTQESKNYALEQISKFDSDLGGTELFQCLSDVLSGTMKKGEESTSSGLLSFPKRVWSSLSSSVGSLRSSPEKIVILMTDGDVGNVDAVTGLIGQYTNGCRVFTIGIGQDVNRFLVEKVAKSSNAFSEVLVDNPDISTVVVKMLDASMKSYYKNPQLNLLTEKGGKIGEETKDWHKVIYPNHFESFYCRLPTKDFIDCRVVQMSCVNGITGKTVNWDFPISQTVDNSPWIPQLFAADAINRLQESTDTVLNTPQIIRLSVDYCVMNDKTSFVVVDDETEVDDSSSEPPLPVDVPQYSSQQQFQPAPQQQASIFVPGPVLDGIPAPPSISAPMAVGGHAMHTLHKHKDTPRPPPVDDADLRTVLTQPLPAHAPAPKKPKPMSMAPEEPEPAKNEMMPMSFAAAAAAEPFIGSTEAGPGTRARDMSDMPDSGISVLDDKPKEISFSSLGMEKRAVRSPIFREGEITTSLDSYDLSRCNTSKEELESDQDLPLSLRHPGLNAQKDSFEGGILRKKEKVGQRRALQLEPHEKLDSEKMDELLQYQRADGSFTFSPASMNLLGWHSSDLVSFATMNGVSEELAFNLWILKWLKSDSLKSNKKYMLITRNLEKWVKGQKLSNPVDKVLSAIPPSSLLA